LTREREREREKRGQEDHYSSTILPSCTLTTSMKKERCLRGVTPHVPLKEDECRLFAGTCHAYTANFFK